MPLNNQPGDHDVSTYDYLTIAEHDPARFLFAITSGLVNQGKLNVGQSNNFPTEYTFPWFFLRQMGADKVLSLALYIDQNLYKSSFHPYGSIMGATKFEVQIGEAHVSGGLVALGNGAHFEASIKNLKQLGGTFGSEGIIKAHINSLTMMTFVAIVKTATRGYDHIYTQATQPEFMAGDKPENILDVAEGCTFIAAKFTAGDEGKDGFVRINCKDYSFLIAQPIWEQLYLSFAGGHEIRRTLSQLVTDSNLKLVIHSEGPTVLEGGLYKKLTAFDPKTLHVFVAKGFAEYDYARSWKEVDFLSTSRFSIAHYIRQETSSQPRFLSSLYFTAKNGTELYSVEVSGENLQGLTEHDLLKVATQLDAYFERYSYSEKTTGLFAGGGIFGVGKTSDVSETARVVPIPTRFKVEGDVYLVSENGKVILQPIEGEVGGNFRVSGKEGVELEHVLAVHFAAHKHEELSIGIGFDFAFDSNVVGVSVEANYKVSRANFINVSPVGHKLDIRGNLIIHSSHGDFIDSGANRIHASNIDINAINVYSNSAKQIISQHLQYTNINGKITVGIANPVGLLLNSAQNAASSSAEAINSIEEFNSSDPENTALSTLAVTLNTLNAYMSIMQFATLLSTTAAAAAEPIPAGEATVEFSTGKLRSHATSEIPSQYTADEKITIKADNLLELHGTIIKGKNGEITAKRAILQAVEDSLSSDALQLMIAGRAGTLGAGANIGGAKMHSEGTRYTLPKIIMQDDLKVTIAEDLSGNFQMRAKHIAIDVRDLLLQSLHDVSKSTAWQAGISASQTAKAKEFLGGLSLSHGNSDRKWVGELAEIIGDDEIAIVVARTLTLIGATISTIHKDLEGRDYDSVALKLKAGELFVHHLYGQDEGVTLGAAIHMASPTLADESPNPFLDQYGIQFGAHDKEQLVASVIGNGDIEIGGIKYGNDMPIPGSNGEHALRDQDQRLHEQTNRDIHEHWYNFSWIKAWIKDRKALSDMVNKAEGNIENIIEDPSNFVAETLQTANDYATNLINLLGGEIPTSTKPEPLAPTHPEPEKEERHTDIPSQTKSEREKEPSHPMHQSKTAKLEDKTKNSHKDEGSEIRYSPYLDSPTDPHDYQVSDYNTPSLMLSGSATNQEDKSGSSGILPGLVDYGLFLSSGNNEMMVACIPEWAAKIKAGFKITGGTINTVVNHAVNKEQNPDTANEKTLISFASSTVSDIALKAFLGSMRLACGLGCVILIDVAGGIVGTISANAFEKYVANDPENLAIWNEFKSDYKKIMSNEEFFKK